MQSLPCCASIATANYAILESNASRDMLSELHPLLVLLSDNSYMGQSIFRSDISGNTCTVVTKTIEPIRPNVSQACGYICNAPLQEEVPMTLNCIYSRQNIELYTAPIAIASNVCSRAELIVTVENVIAAFFNGLRQMMSYRLLRDYFKPVDNLGCNCNTSGTEQTFIQWSRNPIIDLVKEGKTSSANVATDVPTFAEWSQNTTMRLMGTFTDLLLKNGSPTNYTEKIYLGVPTTLFTTLNFNVFPNVITGVQNVGGLFVSQLHSGIQLLRFPDDAFYINEQDRLVLPIFMKGGFTYFTQRPEVSQFTIGTALSTNILLTGANFDALLQAAHNNLRYGGYNAELRLSTMGGGIKLNPYLIGAVLGPKVDPALYPAAQRITTNGDVSKIIVVQNNAMCVRVCNPVSTT